ncbi:HAD family hydrolase [Ectobacillus panaciterrae]|uniref:HAD family hydrolase n=1 Tax=Ectobacillus panaciterrae TaxID=363872 RepID=UPI00041DDF4A|nr:HAD hydrolase family protein [Ectobacillus panaciterrae]
MMFASDLDQTLIYSKKAFRCEMGETDVQLIEVLEGKEISFMTRKAISMLKNLANQVLFVPVTTRTIEQYRRISLFQHEIIPEYAVTSNGGHILHKGMVDKEWSQKIRNKLFECQPKEAILNKFKEIYHEEWVLTQKTADDLFCYAIVAQDRIPHDELEAFGEWLTQNGWTYSLQGRKLYFVPNPVNKWEAVEYIKKMTNKKKVATAGDSLLDLPMLEVADFAFSPVHGELDRMTLSKHIIRTSQSGILASEEILQLAGAALLQQLACTENHNYKQNEVSL